MEKYKGIKKPTEKCKATNIGVVIELREDGLYYNVKTNKSFTIDDIKHDLEKGYIEIMGNDE